MSSRIPQHEYFKNKWCLPSSSVSHHGNSGWTVCGHSKALERTGFILSGPAVTILLDAGVDLANSSAPDIVLITHTHIDHCNALPMLVRHDPRPGNLTHIFVPHLVLNRLREFVQLSFSVKVNEGEELPERYCTPPREMIDNGEPVFAPWEEHTRRWRPVSPGLSIPVALGKAGKQIITVQTVQLFHNRCSSIGYILSERKSKMRPELEGGTKQQTTANVLAAKKRGEQISLNTDIVFFAFICDTSIEAVSGVDASRPQAKLILSSPVVMIECTYLEPEMEGEALKRGHICWSQLCAVVRPIFTDPDRCGKFTVALMHFSLRYSDEDILTFFLDAQRNGMGTVVARKTNGVGAGVGVATAAAAATTEKERQQQEQQLTTAPATACNLVLFLDSGVEEIWYNDCCMLPTTDT